VQTGVAPRAAAFDTDLAATESLFGRWSRFCLQNIMDDQELTALFAPASPNALILTTVVPESKWRLGAAEENVGQQPLSARAKAASMLGYSNESLRAASSLSLCSPRSQAVAMSDALRACWQCMSLGFHSILFQHFALRCCPLHGGPLSTGCPHCGANCTPTFRSVSGQAFSCPQCGQLWLRTSKPAYGDQHLKLVGAMLEDRIKDIFQLAVSSDDALVDQADARSLLKTPRDAHSACHGRHVARWTTWPTLPLARWPRFPESRHVLFDWSTQPGGAWPAGGPLSAHDATACLRSLITTCVRTGHVGDAVMLHSKLSMSPRGLRINANASVVAVALHLTVCTYGKHAPESVMQRPGPHRDPYYDGVVWNGFQIGRRLFNSDAGNAQLLVAEIMGWFAACIVEVAKMRDLQRVDWGGELRKTLFLPAWLVTRSGLHYVLRVRERTSERKIERLLRRYPPQIKLREVRHDSRLERRVGATPDRMGYLPTR
jgi:hypothetical protein